MKKTVSLWLVLVLGLLGGWCDNWALAEEATRTETRESIYLEVNQTMLLPVPAQTSNMAVGNPEIVDIKAVAGKKVLINAKKGGTTNLLFWGEEQQITIPLEVTEHQEELSAQEVQEAISFPGVKARNCGDLIILEGQVGDAAQLAQTQKIADYFGPAVINMVQYQPLLPKEGMIEQQVAVKVRVVEISRTAAREVGVAWPEEVGVGETAIPGFFGINEVQRLEALLLKIKMLETLGKAKVLAEPSLVTVNDKEANILVGGEIPVPILSEAGPDIQWKEYGVRLSVTPHMAADSTINLVVEPSVSTIDWSNSVMVEGSMIPAVRTRSTTTSVVMEDGGTMVISGLLQASLARKVQEVPLMGRLPLVGSLFKTHKDVDEETDLLILVTAQKAREADAPAALIDENGQIETEKGGGDDLGR